MTIEPEASLYLNGMCGSHYFMKMNAQNWGLLLILFITSLSLLIVISYSRFGQIGLEAISIITTGLLSLALVVLYWQQHQSLRYQQKPYLEISDVEFLENLETLNIEISNFGGGPATSMDVVIEIYILDDDEPIDSVRGRLRRFERVRDGVVEKTRSSSILPSETNIKFESTSETVISMGIGLNSQNSVAKTLTRIFNDGERVIYGKLMLEYSTKFDERETYTADFSLKFIENDKIECEATDYLPWREKNPKKELGG